MKVNLTKSVLLASLLSPLAAYAHPIPNGASQGPTARTRSVVFHDRSPRLREHVLAPHK